ncbi:MAG: tetratricopeptide repeat protein [Bacteroidales bacterium]|nr:tetratricopeptide repeat protein [Bacteroidales bacterium]
MELKIKPDKIKSLGYLLNRVFEKDHAGKPKFGFLLGAGCSIYSGIPSGWGVIERCRAISFLNNHADGFKIKRDQYKTWLDYYTQAEKFREDRKAEYDQFVKVTEERFRNRLTEKQVREIIPDEIEEEDDFDMADFTEKVFNDSLYGFWLDEYDQNPKERQMFIENMIEVAEPTGDYILLASLVDGEIIHNVFTTNFDDLVNEALVNYYNVRARVYAHNEMARYISPISKRPNIIKLHGDYLFENIKNTAKETGDLEANMKTKFTEILNTMNLVVIGYGGADHSVMKVLEMAKNSHKYCLLWCNTGEDKLNWRVKHLINSTDNSFFVEVSDFQTLVMKLWTNAGLKLPDLEMDTKERKAKMEDFMKKYSKQIQGNKDVTEAEKVILEDRTEAYKWFNKAYYEKDPAKQYEFYTKAIEFDKNYADAFYNRGCVNIDLKKYEKALEDFERAIELDPSYTNAHYNKGWTFNELGKFDLAIEYFNKAIELSPNYKDAYYNRGWSKTKLYKCEEAIKDFDKVIELDPKYKDAYYNRGWSKNEIGDYSGAILDFDKAIEIEPNYTDAIYNRGWSKTRLDEFEDAIKDFDKVIDIDPNYADAYFNRGWSKSKLGLNKEAIEDYNKVVELKPDNIDAIYNRGWAENALGNYENAIQDFNKVLELDPGYTDAYSNRGFAFHNSNKFKDAIEDYSKVLEKQPDNLIALTNRGLAYTLNREFEKAIEDYQKALNLGSSELSYVVSLIELYIITNRFSEADKNIEKALALPASQNDNDQALLYFMKSILNIMLDHDNTETANRIDELLKKPIEISWNLTEIEDWMKNAKIPAEKLTLLQKFTQNLKEKIV